MSTEQILSSGKKCKGALCNMGSRNSFTGPGMVATQQDAIINQTKPPIQLEALIFSNTLSTNKNNLACMSIN